VRPTNSVHRPMGVRRSCKVGETRAAVVLWDDGIVGGDPASEPVCTGLACSSCTGLASARVLDWPVRARVLCVHRTGQCARRNRTAASHRSTLSRHDVEPPLISTPDPRGLRARPRLATFARRGPLRRVTPPIPCEGLSRGDSLSIDSLTIQPSAVPWLAAHAATCMPDRPIAITRRRWPPPSGSKMATTVRRPSSAA
jgi:hypothetical protein